MWVTTRPVVRLYSPQPILPFRVALLRVALAGLKEAIDLATLVNGVTVIGGASDRSDSPSLEAMVGWMLKNYIFILVGDGVCVCELLCVEL